ncbi:hypothetical protein [Photobacterium sanguinicancri]|uniref:Outer membrane protein beta-barrel domain-containing protein n=1 Tax=Photobacterium sanguinicancri TaxID=875932 RepID=A0ABX4FZI3_9GAMM|nr:hypothetical protein [Photobacterium sanguinicancri]OZS44226.1 hypothetical protein ASV53_09190 [Photobacterium sanguinicancri]
MKKAFLALTLSALISAPAIADIHLSPEVKIGAYNGFGLQAGLTDTLGFDAVFVSYSRTEYKKFSYDEKIDTYRIGAQQMFGASKVHGLQIEIGLADYDGQKIRSGNEETKTSTGVSIGASYIFQATPNLGLRAGGDFNTFRSSNTFIPHDFSPNLNIGMTFTF